YAGTYEDPDWPPPPDDEELLPEDQSPFLGEPFPGASFPEGAFPEEPFPEDPFPEDPSRGEDDSFPGEGDSLTAETGGGRAVPTGTGGGRAGNRSTVPRQATPDSRLTPEEARTV